MVTLPALLAGTVTTVGGWSVPSDAAELSTGGSTTEGVSGRLEETVGGDGEHPWLAGVDHYRGDRGAVGGQ